MPKGVSCKLMLDSVEVVLKPVERDALNDTPPPPPQVAIAASGDAVEPEPADRVGDGLAWLAIDQDDGAGEGAAAQSVIDRADERGVSGDWSGSHPSGAVLSRGGTGAGRQRGGDGDECWEPAPRASGGVARLRMV